MSDNVTYPNSSATLFDGSGTDAFNNPEVIQNIAEVAANRYAYLEQQSHEEPVQIEEIQKKLDTLKNFLRVLEEGYDITITPKSEARARAA